MATKATRRITITSPTIIVSLLLLVLPSDNDYHSFADAFAAKRKGKKSNKTGGKSSEPFGGFGTPPPTLDDVLGKFRTRLPHNADSELCPCGSISTIDKKPKTYGECCGPLLDAPGNECTSPLQVLQSRYTSFCYRNVGHVIRTTHEECRDFRQDKIAWAKDLDKNGMFDSFEFVGLEIEREESSLENEAILEFAVRLKGRGHEQSPQNTRISSSLEGEETVVKEKSRFLLDSKTGTWTYAGGDIRSQVGGLEDTTLNV